MTNSSRSRGELSFRLETLHSYYQNEQFVWDIGCDHGELGLSFLKSSEVQEIHLVDPSQSVIDTLIKKLKDSYITLGKVFTHHCQGQSLTVNQKHCCVFIAGMGGKEIGQILTHLLPQLDSSSRIIISPHRKILELRALLNGLPLGLISEQVIWEDGQFYPILNLNPGTHYPKVSLFGESLWDDLIGREYLHHQLSTFDTHKDLASQGYVQYLKERK